MDDVSKAIDTVAAGLIARPDTGDSLKIIGMFHVVCLDKDGNVKWEDDCPNTVTTQGKNAMLDKFLDRGTAYTNGPSMGLLTTVGNAASIYATPSPQVEAANTIATPRGTPTFSAAAAGVKSTSSAVSFAILAAATIVGVSLNYANGTVTVVQDTAATGGILFSTGTFSGGSRAVIASDTINVTYTMTLT